MSDTEDRKEGAADPSSEAPARGFIHRWRRGAESGAEWTVGARERHVSIAVPFRTVERNRAVAASVLASGIAYRLFFWLLPFGLVVGGALGLGDADSIEDALTSGGVPAATVNAIGDVARLTDTDAWWLLIVGLPLLLWSGYTGGKALVLLHALAWDERPPRLKPLTVSLVFTGLCCVYVAAVGLAWYLRDEPWFVGLVAATLAIAPLAGLSLWISLRLPHGDASWTRLLPGAFLVAVGFQALHWCVLTFLVPKLEKSTSYYGSIGIVATLLFFMYFVGWLVVTSPILNSSLHHEHRRQRARTREENAA